jgi:hypothetical protein
MMGKPNRLFAGGAAALAVCLLFSACVIYPEDDGFGSFPEKVRTVFISNGVPSFEAPSEIVGLSLDPTYSDYSSSDSIFLLSYTGAEQYEHFNNYLSYLLDIFGDYAGSINESAYKEYAWSIGNVVISLGFSVSQIRTPDGLSISAIPQKTLYLLVVIY